MERSLFAKYLELPEYADLIGLTPAEKSDAMTARRVGQWRLACSLGRCAYATLEVTKKYPDPHDAQTQCPGRVGSHDPTLGIWRWRRCDRFLDWIERRNAHVRSTEGKGKHDGRANEVPF
jgi:hypothetical protein